MSTPPFKFDVIESPHVPEGTALIGHRDFPPQLYDENGNLLVWHLEVVKPLTMERLSETPEDFAAGVVQFRATETLRLVARRPDVGADGDAADHDGDGTGHLGGDHG